jgi:aspartate kinase
MSSTLVTSIVLKNNVTLVDVVSTRMLGQYGFLARVFEVFSRHKVSVDMVATSEVRRAGGRCGPARRPA